MTDARLRALRAVAEKPLQWWEADIKAGLRSVNSPRVWGTLEDAGLVERYFGGTNKLISITEAGRHALDGESK